MLSDLTGNPYWLDDHKKKIYIKPCYYCWILNSFKEPYNAAFTIITFLTSLGMIKLLCTECCCKDRAGRYFDVAGILLGTTSREHTMKYIMLLNPAIVLNFSLFFRKTRTASLEFMLGACFFVYLPILPCLLLVCSWRRRWEAKKRLARKAKRKKYRLMQQKKAGEVF